MLVAEDTHAPTEEPVDRRLEGEGRLSVREAGKELAALRRKANEGDEEFARAMGEVPPSDDMDEQDRRFAEASDLSDKLNTAAYEAERAVTQLDERVAAYETKLKEQQAEIE